MISANLTGKLLKLFRWYDMNHTLLVLRSLSFDPFLVASLWRLLVSTFFFSNPWTLHPGTPPRVHHRRNFTPNHDHLRGATFQRTDGVTRNDRWLTKGCWVSSYHPLKKGLVEVRLSINETLKIRVKFFDEFQLTTFPDIFRNIWFIRIDIWHRNLPQKLGMNIFHTPSAEMAFGAI